MLRTGVEAKQKRNRTLSKSLLPDDVNVGTVQFDASQSSRHSEHSTTEMRRKKEALTSWTCVPLQLFKVLSFTSQSSRE